MSTNTDAPPSYDDAINLTKSLSSPEAQEKFKLAIKQVTVSLDSIQQDIDKILTGLDQVKDTDALAIEWGGIKKTYTTLRWESKDNASRVATFATQLGTAQLPIVAGDFGPMSPADLVQALEFFHKQNAPLGQATTNDLTQFKAFQKSVQDFAEKFEKFYQTHGVPEEEHAAKLRKEIAELATQIAALDAEIRRLVEEKLSTKLKRVSWMRYIPGATGLIMLIDLVEDKILKPELDKKLNEYNSLSASSRKKQLELDAALATAAAINKLRAMITYLGDSRLQDIVNGYTIFHDVYDGVDLDVQELIVYARDQTSPKPVSLVIYEATRKSVYAGIVLGLLQFAIGAR